MNLVVFLVLTESGCLYLGRNDCPWSGETGISCELVKMLIPSSDIYGKLKRIACNNCNFLLQMQDNSLWLGSDWMMFSQEESEQGLWRKIENVPKGEIEDIFFVSEEKMFLRVKNEGKYSLWMLKVYCVYCGELSSLSFSEIKYPGFLDCIAEAYGNTCDTLNSVTSESLKLGI